MQGLGEICPLSEPLDLGYFENYATRTAGNGLLYFSKRTVQAFAKP
ncbi:hypothetical protein T01_6122 [Trichinella spiralis]|uniref:Uncharacterized protein n=1 Tax=Trichinella spiralis TaxID=6334 RepID=A0A0V0YWU7_TRISP|nr:hypothetical protein T01_10614 [Trichinella spiralis]KRY04603.1 hypothetical protein T01_6122 [Trichinella spiralis]